MPANVTQGIGFIRCIKSFQQPVFSEAEVDALMHAVQTGRRAPTLATHRAHVQNLKRRSAPSAELTIPEMWQRATASHRDIRPESGSTILGLLDRPKCRTMQSL